MRKFVCFIALFLYAMGTIGGIGYAIYSGAWVIAVAVLWLGVMAFSTARNFYDELIR